MGSGNVLVVLAILVLAAVAGALVVFLARSRESAGRIDRLLAETARAREASQSVDRRFEELRRTMDTRVDGIDKRLAAGQQNVADHLGKSGHLLKELGERLGRLTRRPRRSRSSRATSRGSRTC